MVISKQLCILTLFTHLAVIASGETDQTIGREAEPGADPATISGSLYLDPWQIEKEFLLTPLALQEWLELELQPDSLLSPEHRNALKPVIGKFLAARCPVSIRDEPVPFTLDRINFIQPDSLEFTPISPDQTVTAGETWISVVFSAPQSDHRQALQLMWDLMPQAPDSVTIKVADPEGTRKFELSRLNPALNVRGRFHPNARTPPPLPPSIVDSPPRLLTLPWMSVLLLAAAILWGLRLLHARKKSLLRMTAIILIGLGAIPARAISIKVPLNNTWNAVSDTDAMEILDPLLRRIYHSFNYTNQEQQYEELSLAASGEALTPIFLELQRTLRSRERDGSRVRVNTIKISACTVSDLKERPGFDALCEWQASGRVGHWGHFHDRTNSYNASFTIEPSSGTWKITRLDLHSRERNPDARQSAPRLPE